MRLFGQRGRIIITITIDDDGQPSDWTVLSLGPIEGDTQKGG